MTVTPEDANIEKWYVMAAYKFELKAEASLREAGIEVYLPKETVYIKKPRRRPVAVERPAISTLIFVHATLTRILEYKRHVDDRLKFRMTPITSRSASTSSLPSRPSLPSSPSGPTSSPSQSGKDFLTVPDTQMAAFISIWAARDTLKASLSPLDPTVLSTSPLPVGTPVEIISGPLAGLRAITLSPITSRSRTTRLSLTLASLLSLTLTLPTSSLSPL